MSAGYWISTSCTSSTTTTTSCSNYNPLGQTVWVSQAPPIIAHRLEFNKYVNASDMLEQFIRDMGDLGLSQEEFLLLPVNAFITWLIMKAAMADGEVSMWRCKSCGRFTKEGLVACSPHHARKLLSV